tara:strand:- start:1461 stop:3317 length:1857 start_codon:yes stop_codon:yes gene_type:complete
MQNQPMQMKGVADILANQGRYGDSMLVHMNPVEVQGLASLSPTGSLTVNPQTGQPEAFLPFLAPLLGSVFGSTVLAGAIPALAGKTALAGAIGSGLATAAAEGDLKKGLISGITGFGIGSAVGNILGSGTDALRAGAEQAAKVASDATKGATILGAGSADDIANIAKIAGETARTEGISEFVKGMKPTERIKELFTKEGIGKLATSPAALVGTAVGEGTNLDLERREAMKAMSAASEADREYQAARSQAIIDQNVFPGTTMPAPAQDYSSYGTQYANAGGIVSLDPNDFRRRFNGLVEMDDSIQRMRRGGRFTTTTTTPVSSSDFPDFIPGMPYDPVGMGGTPSSRQQALRGRRPITQEELDARLGYTGMAGFGPEIKYFTDEDPFDQIIAPFSDTAKADPRLTDIMFDFNVGNITGDEVKKAVEAFEPKTEEATEVAKEGDPLANLPEGYEYGLEYLRRYGVPMNFMAEGGETKNMPDQKTDRLISLAQQAIRGELEEEEADAIIQMFIDELGVEAFRALREVTLEEIVPGSQKEGEIVGQGGGMDDLVPGMIGNNQRLAASPGEYIVPADVVSGLGDGSTDAGVQELDGMLDRVRMERTATTQQPAPLPKGGVLPA